MIALTTDAGPVGFKYGTVFAFTKDFTATFPFKNMRPGVHFLYIEVSASGYCFTAWDTQRQCRTTFMNEDWLVKHLRALGNVTTSISTNEED